MSTSALPSSNVLDHLIEGCQVISFDYRYLYLNDAAARQGRRNRADLIGKTMMEAYPGINQSSFFPVLTQCMTDRVAHRMENEFRFPDGGVGWFELRFEPVPEGVFILSLDITERKRGEQELQRLSTAIRHSAEAVIITDCDGHIVYVNPAFESISGYSESESIGLTPRILKSGKQDADFYKEMWGALAEGKTWRGRLVNRRKDGALFTEEATISPMFDELGAISHYICVKRDMTRVLALEEQFRQAQKMEAIGQLAGGVAHDFNNLLSVVIGYADAMLPGLDADDQMRKDLLEIRRAGEKGTALTRQLLAFSRKQVVESEVVDLNVLVTSMRDMIGRLIGEHIELVTTLAPDLGRVKVNTTQMEQVIMNLAVNARDAMPGGGKLVIETANVQVDSDYVGAHIDAREGPHVQLMISDNGTGMDEATLARVFEPFFTTKGAEHGTGLGLSTVYGIIKQSGGATWVYSEPGLGTTFKIYLPEHKGIGRQTTPGKRPALKATGSETILLVEDEPAVRSITKRLLSGAGYSVLDAAGGKEALEILSQSGVKLNLLITDLVMPEMSGVELAKYALELRPALQILYMSGYAENSVAHFDSLDEQAQFIGKPFSAADLARKVREILDASPPA